MKLARTRIAPALFASLLALVAFGASPALAAPPNDNFADAVTISSGSPFATSNVGATAESGEPSIGAPGAYNSVWFKFTSPGPGYIEFDTCTTSIDTVISAHTGTAVNALSLAAGGSWADAGCPSGGGSKIPSIPVASGTKVYFSVRSYDVGEQGNFTAALTFSQYVPANDDWAGAQDLGSSISEPDLAGDNTYATTDNLAPLVIPTNPGYHSVWYKWTSPIDGNVLWDTCLSTGRDTVLGAFSTSASVPSLALMSLVEADDDGCGTFGGPSELVLAAHGGTTYWIELAGYDNTNNSYGQYLLRLSTAFANHTAPVVGIGQSNKVGDSLHSSTGTWIGASISYAYQWQRCTPDLLSCAPIDGATTSDYKLVSADIGKRINAKITATPSGNSPGYATSNATTTILDIDSDGDGDGVLDQADACPASAGTQANGCTPAAVVIRKLPFSLPKSFARTPVTKKGGIKLSEFNFTCPANATARCSVAVTVNAKGKSKAKLAANLVGLNLSEKLKTIPLKLNKAGKKLLQKNRQITVTVSVKITAPGYEPFEDKKPVKVGGIKSVANPLYDLKTK